MLQNVFVVLITIQLWICMQRLVSKMVYGKLLSDLKTRMKSSLSCSFYREIALL